MKTAQQIRKEMVEQTYSDLLEKIETQIEVNKHFGEIKVYVNYNDINAKEIIDYMVDLGYSCDLCDAYMYEPEKSYLKISW